MSMNGGFDLLEHTADVGIRAWGDSLEGAFEQAAWGLAEVLGIRVPDDGQVRTVRATADDLGALLVDFLNELVLLHETEEAAFADIRVLRVSDAQLEADVRVRPLNGAPGGIPVKAATFHQLSVDRSPDGRVEVRVYLDV